MVTMMFSPTGGVQTLTSMLRDNHDLMVRCKAAEVVSYLAVDRLNQEKIGRSEDLLQSLIQLLEEQVRCHVPAAGQ